MVTMTPRKLLIAPFFVLILAACGGGEETASAGVASALDLDESVATETATDTAGAEDADAEDLTAEEAGLALAECMRDFGFADFPDPQIDANGNVNLRNAIADSGINFQDEGFQEGIQACGDEVGADNFGAGARQNQANGIQEQLLGYTECLRDQGLDVGDLELGGGAGARPGAGNGAQPGAGNGDGDGAGRGRAQGNGGNVDGRGARIAQALGLDTEDPATAEAIAACDEVLAEAFAGVGGGQPPAATEAT